MFDPRRLFDSTDRNSEGVARVRFGRGVVGNTTYAAIAFAGTAAATFAALRDNPPYALGGVGIEALVFIIYLLGTWRFADKHPDRAMLGDTEWLRHQEMQFAALGYAQVPYTRPTGPTIHPTSAKTEDV